MIITHPSITFKHDLVASIINTVGKPVVLKLESVRERCPTCLGNDPFCLTCAGNGFVYSVRDVTVTGSVRWKSLEQKRYRPEGQYVDGDCTVTIEYTEALEALMYSVKEVIVDNRRCVIDRWNLHGSPTNRLYLILKEDASLIGTRVS